MPIESMTHLINLHANIQDSQKIVTLGSKNSKREYLEIIFNIFIEQVVELLLISILTFDTFIF